MSLWRVGKIDIKCPLDVFVKILVGVRSSWENQIQTDPDCNLTVTDEYGGSTYKCHIKINKTTGFAQNKNSKWVFYGSDTGYLENDIKSELALYKVKQQAVQRQAVLVEEEDNGNQQRLVFHVPMGPKYKLYA